MKMLKLCLALILSVSFATAAKQCSVFLEIDGEPMPCYEQVDGSYVTVGVESCTDHPRCCVKDEGDQAACYVEGGKSAGSRSLVSDKTILVDYFSSVDDAVKKAKATQEKTQARFLNLGPQLGFPGCQPPVPFPANCRPIRDEPFVLDPPTDVPYCVRIPCPADNNGQFEKSHKLCGSQPGCYFDKELFEYREAFGQSVLPGVPVCHLAIRNKVFHKIAQKVVQEHGSWNPYFTNCLLNEHDEEISTGPKGCDLLPILDVFHIKPKLAGWETITTRECALIDGCFRPGYGCFYPVDISNVVVKSGQRQVGFSRKEIVYGRPRCQHFDNSSPINTLRSYHTCLASGCSVDTSVTALYYNHLYSIGEGFSVKNHWEYWGSVKKGLIGAYNIDDTLGEYDFNPTKVTQPTPTPPSLNDLFASSMDNLFAPPSLGNTFSNPLANLYPQPSTKPQLSFPQMSFLGGASQACGPAFKYFGARPCAPLRISPPAPNTYCPYKPFFVPRFPVLKGKFDGCCEVNLCYLPKSEISRMHSGPSYYYTEWSLFSSCSATCGVGEKRRHRRCISSDKSRCTESMAEVRSCQEAPCASWSQWSEYSPCPNTCYPGGIQTRTRKCLPSTGQCEGRGEEVQSCNRRACTVKKGVWSQWKRENCDYNRNTGKCVETLKRHCTYLGLPVGKCTGRSRDTRKYSCRGCFMHG